MASIVSAARLARSFPGCRSARSASLPPRAVLQSAPPVSLPSSAPSSAPAAPRIGWTQQDGALAKYGGVSVAKLEQVFPASGSLGLAQALAGSASDLPPAAAAQLARRLEAELPTAATDVTPSGDCVLVTLAPGLLPLLERSLEHCEDSLARGQLAEATHTGRLLLGLLCRLRFGSRTSAAGYASLATRCKLALKVAYDAGAPIRQEDMVDLYASCARSSPWLWLTPYLGHRCACAVDGFITQGWASGELAVRFCEAYCALTGRGRYTQVTSKFVRLVRAALKHPLSAAQLRRLLAAAERLPVDMRLALEIHARSEPADCWYAALTERLREAGAPAAATRPSGASARRGADGAVLNGAVAVAAAAVRRGKRGASAAAARQGA
ncbi:hypothetical protein ABPG75_008661 [Micractinium tetrahymenae]